VAADALGLGGETGRIAEGYAADLLAVVGQPAERAHALGAADLLERLEADIRPSRVKCLTLPLSVLRSALAGKAVAR